MCGSQGWGHPRGTQPRLSGPTGPAQLPALPQSPEPVRHPWVHLQTDAMHEHLLPSLLTLALLCPPPGRPEEARKQSSIHCSVAWALGRIQEPVSNRSHLLTGQGLALPGCTLGSSKKMRWLEKGVQSRRTADIAKQPGLLGHQAKPTCDLESITGEPAVCWGQARSIGLTPDRRVDRHTHRYIHTMSGARTCPRTLLPSCPPRCHF